MGGAEQALACARRTVLLCLGVACEGCSPARRGTPPQVTLPMRCPVVCQLGPERARAQVSEVSHNRPRDEKEESHLAPAAEPPRATPPAWRQPAGPSVRSQGSRTKTTALGLPVTGRRTALMSPKEARSARAIRGCGVGEGCRQLPYSMRPPAGLPHCTPRGTSQRA